MTEKKEKYQVGHGYGFHLKNEHGVVTEVVIGEINKAKAVTGRILELSPSEIEGQEYKLVKVNKADAKQAADDMEDREDKSPVTTRENIPGGRGKKISVKETMKKLKDAGKKARSKKKK